MYYTFPFTNVPFTWIMTRAYNSSPMRRRYVTSQLFPLLQFVFKTQVSVGSSASIDIQERGESVRSIPQWMCTISFEATWLEKSNPKPMGKQQGFSPTSLHKTRENETNIIWAVYSMITLHCILFFGCHFSLYFCLYLYLLQMLVSPMFIYYGLNQSILCMYSEHSNPVKM